MAWRSEGPVHLEVVWEPGDAFRFALLIRLEDHTDTDDHQTKHKNADDHSDWLSRLSWPVIAAVSNLYHLPVVSELSAECCSHIVGQVAGLVVAVAGAVGVVHFHVDDDRLLLTERPNAACDASVEAGVLFFHIKI